MARRAKKLNLEPMTLLKQSVCVRCGGIKLLGKCPDCESERQRMRDLKDEHPEQFASTNWTLRSKEDKQRNTRAKQKSREMKRIIKSRCNDQLGTDADSTAEPTSCDKDFDQAPATNGTGLNFKDQVLKVLWRVQQAALKLATE